MSNSTRARDVLDGDEPVTAALTAAGEQWHEAGSPDAGPERLALEEAAGLVGVGRDDTLEEANWQDGAAEAVASVEVASEMAEQGEDVSFRDALGSVGAGTDSTSDGPTVSDVPEQLGPGFEDVDPEYFRWVAAQGVSDADMGDVRESVQPPIAEPPDLGPRSDESTGLEPEF